MANNQFRCAECSFKKCVICQGKFYVSPSLDKRKCCSKKCKDILQTKKEYTPEQRLNHKMAMHKVFLTRKIEGMRKCTVCGIQKIDKDFSLQKSKITNTGTCLECKRKKDHIGYFKHHDKRIKAYRKSMQDPVKYVKIRKGNIIATSKRRAGLNRLETIFPNTQCYVCGITQEEHLRKVKRLGKGIGLSIHHIDNKGRRAMAMGFKPNNSPDNLMILCSSCHLRQHNYERDYSGQGFKAWKTRRKNLLIK